MSPTRRPKVLVVVGSLVLVAACLPLVRVLTEGDGPWLWLALLSTRRAAVSAVALSALAVVVVGVAWWVDEQRHARRARAETQWLADVGPSTSTWAPRWVTLGGLGFVALGFVLVFASGGEDGGEAPWGAPEAVAPVVSLVKLVGGLLLLAAPGTLFGGGVWWVSRHQVRTSQSGTRPDGPGRSTGPDGARLTPGRSAVPSGPPGESPATELDADGTGAAPSEVRPSVTRTTVRRLALTGPRRPTWLVAAGAALVLVGAVVAVVANVTASGQVFPGEAAPPGGLLRCCTFVAAGTALTIWSVVACWLLWTGLTAVAVGASWWDTERQAGRPDAPAWIDRLKPDSASPVVGVFPPTGAPPEPDQAESGETTPGATARPAPRGRPRRACLLVLVGVVVGLVGVLLTVSLQAERVGGTVYFYDAGPAVLGPVFGLPVGLALVVSGGLWWLGTRRDPDQPVRASRADPA